MSDRQKYVNQALRTLRRIPDSVILSMGTVEYSMGMPHACVCGWAIRADLLAATGTDAYDGDPRRIASERFGGTWEEWRAIFSGVCYDEHDDLRDFPMLPDIELAFVCRIDEAVRRA